MAVTIKDLENMMKKQKEEREEEMKTLKSLLMEGVKEEIKVQIGDIRTEVDEKVAAVQEELENKLSAMDHKHSEVINVQSVLDSRVDMLESEIKALREMTKNKCSESESSSDTNSDTSEDVSKLVEYAVKVVGFKPIENKDVLRQKRMFDIEDDTQAKQSCLKEFWRCELRMPTTVVDSLLENIENIFSAPEKDWDKLFVEFKDERSAKLCYSYCKFMRNKESQIVQFFPPEFRDQYRTLDSIAYKLRKPDDTYATKFKTRIRFSRQGLILEKRHPEQRNWTNVSVSHLPPVDLQPVPLPAASNSPPSERQRDRDSKRPRSPLQTSLAAERPSKNSRVVKGNLDKNVTSLEDVHDNFVFKNLVDKFASK